MPNVQLVRTVMREMLTRERSQQELALQLALAAPLMASQGYGALDVEQAYARAQALCERLGDDASPQLFQVLPCHLSFAGQESRDRRIGNARGGGDGVPSDSLGFDKVSKHVGSTYVGNENVLVLITLDNVA